MTRIVVDADLRTKLLNLTEFVELVDDQGKVLATVLPQVGPSRYQQFECPHDEAELQRRENSNARRYSLQEMLDHLRKL